MNFCGVLWSAKVYKLTAKRGDGSQSKAGKRFIKKKKSPL
jgi:hypothetical protein